MTDKSHDRLSLLERRLDPAFEKRVIVVAPESLRDYDEAEWRDALVVVERGEIELKSAAKDCRTFRAGDVLCLDGLPLRTLRNRGGRDAVLVAFSRRRQSTD